MIGEIVIIIGLWISTIMTFLIVKDEWCLFEYSKKERNMNRIKNILPFLICFVLSVVLTYAEINDYRHPENEARRLNEKVINAEKELQKYLDKHPEVKGIE